MKHLKTHGSVWQGEEIETLRNGLVNSLPIRSIAEQLGRTDWSVRVKAIEIGLLGSSGIVCLAG